MIKGLVIFVVGLIGMIATFMIIKRGYEIEGPDQIDRRTYVELIILLGVFYGSIMLLGVMVGLGWIVIN